ncbi:tryptophan aminotransferase-related protein 4-like [Telopea speciosissima]|uniref:tryptophan aminotransferase-related protein 4-like n=1 Tax=Telopea speciosissima TaxID=54955 RepID=UPI001CC3B3E5|nr:tryptophan aminotransferase-related protein 4-like [Telopea speciosissima]
MSSFSNALYVVSLLFNLFFFFNFFLVRHHGMLTWTRKSAEEAEEVASIYCSGHGKAYLDGGLVSQGGKHVCECSLCYGGPDCSEILPSCPANADGGDPLYLEPYWMQHEASSAVTISGWHRMSYSFPESAFLSAELTKQILKLHTSVGNAITEGKFIVFGVGSTQLLHASLYALSDDDRLLKPVNVVARAPYYPMYQAHASMFKSRNFEWQGDASLWKNNISNLNSTKSFIEIVTSPNNPDSNLREPVLQGSNVKIMYDHAYYWPHYSAIPAPVNEELMIFTLSKIMGHAGSRFGWALIKDAMVYERMTTYLKLNTLGVSHETQVRALELLKVVLEDEGKALFEFGHKAIADRWEKLNKIISQSKRFSLQKFSPQYCTYLQDVHRPSPAYAWLKCEMEEYQECHKVLEAAGIIGRPGGFFGVEDSYVRLTLLRSDDDFNLLLQRLENLVSKELIDII